MASNDPTSGWVDPNPPDATNPRVDRVLISAGALLTVVVLLTLIGVVVAKHQGMFGDSSPDGPSIVLVRANVEGDQPFMPSVVVTPIEIVDTVESDSASFAAQLPRSAARGARLVQGTQRGLYGAVGEGTICDVPAVANHLDAHPERSAAWGDAVGGIATQHIPYYLNTLTPVVLIADTWVTDAGFEDGQPVYDQVVLQAGTAVLIDQVGVPRAHCATANPLAPPANIDLATLSPEGDPWPSFSPDGIVAVAYSADSEARPADEFELRDIATGESVTRKAGGTIAIGPEPSGWKPDPVAMNVPAKS